jgi:hypothetical protein
LDPHRSQAYLAALANPLPLPTTLTALGVL